MCGAVRWVRKPVPNLAEEVRTLPQTVENLVFDSSHAFKPSVAGLCVYSLLKGLSKCKQVYARTPRLSRLTLTVFLRYGKETRTLARRPAKRFTLLSLQDGAHTRFRLPSTYLVEVLLKNSFTPEI